MRRCYNTAMSNQMRSYRWKWAESDVTISRCPIFPRSQVRINLAWHKAFHRRWNMMPHLSDLSQNGQFMLGTTVITVYRVHSVQHSQCSMGQWTISIKHTKQSTACFFATFFGVIVISVLLLVWHFLHQCSLISYSVFVQVQLHYQTVTLVHNLTFPSNTTAWAHDTSRTPATGIRHLTSYTVILQCLMVDQWLDSFYFLTVVSTFQAILRFNS